jgi:hypothetical protein
MRRVEDRKFDNQVVILQSIVVALKIILVFQKDNGKSDEEHSRSPSRMVRK